MKIAFQGAFGANSHQAVNERFPNGEAIPCHDFRAAFDSVENGHTDAALIPIDNTSAGRGRGHPLPAASIEAVHPR